MRQLLGESAGEELCYQKEGLNIPGVNVGVHMLDYRAKHYDGTWNAQIQNTKFWTRWTNPFTMPTMDKVLSDFASGANGNENAFSYASHPVSEIPWAYGQNDLPDKMRSALSDYYRVGDKSFPYKGMQVWNARGARHLDAKRGDIAEDEAATGSRHLAGESPHELIVEGQELFELAQGLGQIFLQG